MNKDEALADFIATASKASWGRFLLGEDEPDTAMAFVAGKTGGWDHMKVVSRVRSTGERAYDGTATHSSGLTLRLPPEVAKLAHDAACRRLYGWRS